MSSHAAPSSPTARKPVTLPRLRDMHARGERIAVLTCYDSGFARLLDEVGVDALLVGDSLGMVVQGRTSTLPVTLDEIAYHTRCVAAGNRSAWLIADLPFASYHATREQAIQSGAALMQAGAQMIKLEGGGWTTELVQALVERGMPVCAHLGLTPQSIHALGGFRVQGRSDEAAATLIRHATELHQAGAAMLVLELIPAPLSERVRQAVPDLVTIGIGAGPHVSGQVLVLHDMLGVTRGPLPRFVRNFSAGAAHVEASVRAYVTDVKNGAYPAKEHYDY